MMGSRGGRYNIWWVLAVIIHIGRTLRLGTLITWFVLTFAATPYTTASPGVEGWSKLIYGVPWSNVVRQRTKWTKPGRRNTSRQHNDQRTVGQNFQTKRENSVSRLARSCRSRSKMPLIVINEFTYTYGVIHMIKKRNWENKWIH